MLRRKLERHDDWETALGCYRERAGVGAYGRFR